MLLEGLDEIGERIAARDQCAPLEVRVGEGFIGPSDGAWREVEGTDDPYLVVVQTLRIKPYVRAWGAAAKQHDVTATAGQLGSRLPDFDLSSALDDYVSTATLRRVEDLGTRRLEVGEHPRGSQSARMLCARRVATEHEDAFDSTGTEHEQMEQADGSCAQQQDHVIGSQRDGFESVHDACERFEQGGDGERQLRRLSIHVDGDDMGRELDVLGVCAEHHLLHDRFAEVLLLPCAVVAVSARCGGHRHYGIARSEVAHPRSDIDDLARELVAKRRRHRELRVPASVRFDVGPAREGSPYTQDDIARARHRTRDITQGDLAGANQDMRTHGGRALCWCRNDRHRMLHTGYRYLWVVGLSTRCRATAMTGRARHAIASERMARSESSALAARHPEVAALLQAAASGASKPAYLFVGEPFDTRAAATALLDVLVPPARRTFNVETYDGRTASIATIIDSARTPGFFPGLKVLWVRESSLFLSGEKRPDVTRALIAAWNDGRETEAAEKLLTLVAMAGWSQAEFRDSRWTAIPKTRLREVFGEVPEDQALIVIEAVHAECMARDLGVSTYRDDSGALLELLDAGVATSTVLLFTTSTMDARKRVVKRLRELGAVVELSVGRERSGALSRETVDAVVQQTLRDFDKRLTQEAQQLVAQRAGVDLAQLSGEMEKLCLYVGEQASVTAADVRTVFRDMAESWIFDFTSALAARQLARALPLLRGLNEQGEPALRLLAMISREVRMLLAARECLDGPLKVAWRGGLPFNVFQSRVLPLLDDETKQAFGNVHPFVLYRRFQDAGGVSATALRAALVRLSDLDVRFKSSRTDPYTLLEAFLIEWCGVGRAVGARRG